MDNKANSTTEIFFVSLLGLKQFWGSILEIHSSSKGFMLSSFPHSLYRLGGYRPVLGIEERETPIGLGHVQCGLSLTV